MDKDKFYQTLCSAEGERSTVYDDMTGRDIKAGVIVRGNPTIGIGRNLIANPLTIDEQYFLLSNDVERSVACARLLFTDFDQWSDARQRAVAEAIFNLGAAAFEGFTQTIDALRHADWDAAAKDVLASKWAIELPTRVGRISTMIRTGQD